MLHIEKKFGSVRANDDVTFDVNKGEIHAVVGGNGAGKSTLMRVLFGILKPDSGTIKIKGKSKNFNSPLDAIAENIGMVHQDFVLVDTLSALDNIILGREPVRFGFLKRDSIKEKINHLIETYRLYFDPDEKAGNLTLGEQQRTELIKILLQDAELLILDEPTASLTGSEVEFLFGILRRLKDAGKSIVFISHKLPEVLEIADRISVMRNGKMQTTMDSEPATMENLTGLMAGEKLVLKDTDYLKEKETLFVLKDITSKRNKEEFLDVSFDVKRGEITAVVGIDGNGQKELEEILSGISAPESGQIHFQGSSYKNVSPGWLKDNNICFIPSKKNEDGLIENFPVYENMILGKLDEPEFAKFGILQNDSIIGETQKLLTDFDIQPLNPHLEIKYLSGGNQQKVILARELSKKPVLLIACNPTRGVDIKSTYFIHNKLLKLKEEGTGILLITSDVNEAFKVATTIAVLYRGKIMGILSTSDATQREVEFMMLGGGHKGHSVN